MLAWLLLKINYTLLGWIRYLGGKGCTHYEFINQFAVFFHTSETLIWIFVGSLAVYDLSTSSPKLDKGLNAGLIVLGQFEAKNSKTAGLSSRMRVHCFDFRRTQEGRHTRH